MALSHYTLAVTATGSAATPAAGYTKSLLDNFGVGYVIAQTNQDVWFTLDGATTPVPTAASEVGQKLDSDNQGIILTVDEFLASKWVMASAAARVQFVFRQGTRITM